MATRLYMVATTAPSATPTPDGGWPDTAQMVRRTLATTQAATTETLSGTTSGAAGNYALVVQLISPPLSGAQSISGTWTAISRGRELDALDNLNSRARAARVYDSGGTLRGTLVAQGAAASTTEMGTALGGQQHALTSGVTTVAAQDGDYIVVELGFGHNAVTGTTPQWEMALGGAGTDHGTANNDATGTVPWVEFSATLTFQSGSTVTGVATADFTFTATASGVRTVLGTAATSLAFTATASGVRTVLGAASSAFAFSATASGVREVLGQAAAQFAFTATAAGSVSTPGQLVLRPNTGTTTRPASGTVTRPDTGVVSRP